MAIEGIIDQDFIQQQVELTKGSGSGNDDGFDPDMFLKILMVQLQNQSPFDTVDSSEILNQQATLTQVEQITRQTQTMKEMNDSVTANLSNIKDSLAQINSSLNILINK
jgi:flagellar hook assembly protein FlgD